MASCPFCGASETDRFEIEGHRFLVFACTFSPEVDSSWSEEELRLHLATDFGPSGTRYFRGMCDRLHLYVTAGEGGRVLRGDAPPSGSA